MQNCSIALQILPLENNDSRRIKTIDNVIHYIQKRHSNVVISPFETVIEGELDELITTLKECLVLAGKDSNNIFANVKINYGSILTIDEKLSKFS
ncbi:thiamine-binding protein [Gemella cuniculi]|uniref:thiamine-binding protein n=1 Tax=Gemella cuniculi TaxID=150240 RepID=UPI000429F254|nr:thiamine-binding protein [Gemella cuniculi]